MERNNNKGFTIVEIMVVLIIAGILISAAVPRISEAFNNYQFSNGMRSIVTAMIRAKGTAIHDGVQTSVTFSMQNGRVTFTAFVDEGTGGGIQGNGILDGGEEIIMTDQLYRDITILPANSTFLTNAQNNPFTQFNHLGFAMGAPGAAVILFPGKILFSPSNGAPITSAKAITVDVAGNIATRGYDARVGG